MNQFQKLVEYYRPPWEFNLTKSGQKRKPKNSYIFYNDDGIIKKHGKLIFFSAFSPKQAITLLKHRYPEYQMQDIAAENYVKLLQKRKSPPKFPPNPAITQPELNFDKTT